jgi:SagB-type dehydrogenase family enzyme
MPAEPDSVEVVFGYHERTKHHPYRYARALGYMDWDTQPDPFRRYEGAQRRPLDEVPVTPLPRYDDLFATNPLPPQPLNRGSLSQFLYDALALSAWKAITDGTGREHRWSLRVNPSSGNLHPTEGYIITGPIAGLLDEPGLHHYAPFQHELERRREIATQAWQRLALPAGSFLLALTSIHWRESWKYGERAFRYCQHDAGHAIAACALSAAALGWKIRMVLVSDLLLARLAGVDGQTGPEAEHPDVLLLVSPSDAAATALDGEHLRPLTDGRLSGVENTLSSDHHDWPIIDLVAEASLRLDPVEPESPPLPSDLPARAADRVLSARQIIRQRRSAVSMDGLTSISREDFLRTMARLMPGAGALQLDLLPWRPSIHLAVFVHRVRDLSSGLYCLVRDPDALLTLRESMRPEFRWTHVEGGLYLLQGGDVQQVARSVSCGQEIAADGAYALGMIGCFEPAIRARGAWFYRALHWEAGAIGQVLYLEAEASGVRATGIGCFFDDAMHQVLGLRDARFQTLYHFTVGGPAEDTRLRTLAPYAHRAGGQAGGAAGPM